MSNRRRSNALSGLSRVGKQDFKAFVGLPSSLSDLLLFTIRMAGMISDSSLFSAFIISPPRIWRSVGFYSLASLALVQQLSLCRCPLLCLSLGFFLFVFREVLAMTLVMLRYLNVIAFDKAYTFPGVVSLNSSTLRCKRALCFAERWNLGGTISDPRYIATVFPTALDQWYPARTH